MCYQLSSTYTHKYRNEHIHRCTQKYILLSYTYTHAHINVIMHTTYTYTQMHAQTCITFLYVHTCTHKYKHAHCMRTHRHKFMHTYVLLWPVAAIRKSEIWHTLHAYIHTYIHRCMHTYMYYLANCCNPGPEFWHTSHKYIHTYTGACTHMYYFGQLLQSGNPKFDTHYMRTYKHTNKHTYIDACTNITLANWRNQEIRILPRRTRSQWFSCRYSFHYMGEWNFPHSRVVWW
jgi:hypothetical protein